MNNFIRFSIFSFAFLLFSCTDPCEDVSCLNDGVCDDGTCLCEVGYEGTNCETESRAKYYGTFGGDLTCPGEDPVEQLIIFEAGPEVNQLLMTDGLDPSFMDTLTFDGDVAASPEREIDFFGELIKLQVTFTFNSEDQTVMRLITTVENQSVSCIGTLDRE